MDEKINELNTNNVYCGNCGTLNTSDNNFCHNCGATIVPPLQEPQIQVPAEASPQNNITPAPKPEDTDTTEQKVLYITLGIVGGILSLVISYFFPPILIAAIAGAITSLFFKRFRAFGITVLVSIGILAITAVVFVIIMFGACIAAFGSM